MCFMLPSEPLHARGSQFWIQTSTFRSNRDPPGLADRRAPRLPESVAPLAFQFRAGFPVSTAGHRRPDRSRSGPDVDEPDPLTLAQYGALPTSCAPHEAVAQL